MRIPTLLCLALLAACGGGSAAGVAPDQGPSATLDQFMGAVADSNLTRMAELWGTSSGSAKSTGKPNDYLRRIAIIHSYLKGTKAKVLSEPERSSNRAVLLVELSRDECHKQVPFTFARTGGGQWLVQAIELGTLGSPGRPCGAEERKPSTP